MGKSKAAKAKEKKKHARKEKLRRERHQRQVVQEPTARSAPGRGALPSVVSERILHLIGAFQGEEPYDSIEQAKAAMSVVLKQDPADLREQLTEPAHQAQQLVYDALEASDPERARELIQEALALDPKSFDARRLSLVAEDPQPDEKVFYERASALAAEAEVALRESGVVDEGGDAWMRVEARPWLRALRAAVSAAIVTGHEDEAFDLARVMIDADLDDHLGVARFAAACAIRTRRLEDARCMIALLADEAVSRWLHGLERAASGDHRGASVLLDLATQEDEELASHVLEVLEAMRAGTPTDVASAELKDDVSALFTAAGADDDLVDIVLRAVRQWADGDEG